jgi:hypothetical protein
MADPVPSVAYAIEAALRALGGHLGLLLPTMGLVIGLIGLVTVNYWQLVRAFPEGGSPEAGGLAAAASSFQAGPGLLKALARPGPRDEDGLVPRRLHGTNHHHTPVAAVVLYAGISAAILLVASGQEQELVLVYAVAVFVSFLAGLLAMARFSHRQGNHWLVATNLIGAVGVAFTPPSSTSLADTHFCRFAGTVLVVALLWWRWIRAGRPAGIEAIEREAEEEAWRGNRQPRCPAGS